MTSKLDHLIIAVSDLDKAEKNYKKVFGIDSVWRGEHKDLGTANVIFNFKNTYFELLASNGVGIGADFVDQTLQDSGEGLIGSVFGSKDIEATAASIKNKGFLLGDISNGEGINLKNNEVRKWKNLFLPPELTRGIFTFIIEHTEGTLPMSNYLDSATIKKLDHVVINTNDADGLIDIYRDVFNIRLALDKVIEHWKARMLFFRLNKTTIEVIEQGHDDHNPDKLWGLAWEVESIEDAHQRLTNEGVEVSEIKKGIKERTMVATIKSHTHNVPTLIIQHLAE
ncbi:MAG: glyoxalase-like domain protein [Gammaproteobacteria bacterium TMED226]|nr:MAG: glyoxalase-like domain protein [Gammaproteobacteria bacterium TMED226]